MRGCVEKRGEVLLCLGLGRLRVAENAIHPDEVLIEGLQSVSVKRVIGEPVDILGVVLYGIAITVETVRRR